MKRYVRCFNFCDILKKNEKKAKIHLSQAHFTMQMKPTAIMGTLHALIKQKCLHFSIFVVAHIASFIRLFASFIR